MGLPGQWDTCFRTIFFEDRPISFAHRGDIIAVGIESNVVLFDAITGIRLSALSGHTGGILSLTFSLDGTLLVSRSSDDTVKLWDIQTGGVINTFGDHASAFSSVSISPDCAIIASGTWDGAIRLWDVHTGECHHIEAHPYDAVTAISFSPTDSRRLITSSMGTIVQQWSTDGHQIGTPHREGAVVTHITYTPDGTRFASCAGDFATLRDSETGAVAVKLDAPNRSSIRQCCFSPDGRYMACAADRIIYIWDITSPDVRPVGNLVGHYHSIAFLTFPSSLISADTDRSLKFWQSNSFLTDSVATNNTAALHGSTPIRSAKLFAKSRTVVTSDEYGVVNTWDLMTGRRKASFSTPAKGIRDTHLAGDTLVIVWWLDEEKQYHIWDVGKGQLLRRVSSPFGRINDLRIAEDGTKIFGLGGGRIEARSMQTGETVGHVRLKGGIGSTLILHGSTVEYEDKKSWGWYFGDQEVSDYKELLDRPRLDVVDWVDGRRVKPRWVEDTVTGRRIFRLPERYMKSDTKIEWDGRYLLVWSRVGEVMVIDFDPVSP